MTHFKMPNILHAVKNLFVAASKPASGKPIIVTSLPKAGTYLLGEFLLQLGYRHSFMHLFEDSADHYDASDLERGRKFPLEYKRAQMLEDSLKELDAQSFAVGHLIPNAYVLAQLRRCNVVFLKRNLKDCIVSYLRFNCSTGRDNTKDKPWYHMTDRREQLVAYMKERAENMIKSAENLFPWEEQENILTVRFEDIKENPGAGLEIIRLANYLGKKCNPAEAEQMAETAYATKTLTSSGKTSVRGEYWSEDAEKIFREYGGNKVNRKFGYDDNV